MVHRGTECPEVQRYRVGGGALEGEERKQTHLTHRSGAWLKSSGEYCLSLLPSESNGLHM